MDKLLRKIASNHFIKLFSNTAYLNFSLSVFFSQVASNMLTIVLIFLIFFLTSSNFSVSILLFTILIPQIFISFIGGVIADNRDKKKILVYGNLFRAIALILLFLNHNSPVIIYLVTFVISVITQFYVPAESPLIPQLVSRDKLVAANSIFGMSFFGSILIGYVIAGPAVQVLGRGNIFLVLAFIFLLATVFAALIPYKSNTHNAPKIDFELINHAVRSELRECLQLIRESSRIGNAFFLLIVSQIIIFILATLIPGYAQNILQVKAEEVSLILFLPAALGMLITGILLGSVFAKNKRDKIMNIGVYISGIVLCLLPATSRIFSQGIIQTINDLLPQASLNIFNFVLLLAFLAGCANALIFIPSQAEIQEIVPENYRSRVYGLLFSLIGLTSLIPIIIAGGVADILGVGTVLVVLGLIIIALGFARHKIMRATLRVLRR